MDYQGMAHAKKQFDKQNGNDAIQIDGWLVFSNGAMREMAPVGIWCDPPNDTYACAKIKVKYREAKLAQATQAFKTLKQELTWQADNAVKYAAAETPPEPPSADQIAELRNLQSMVRKCQKELTVARTELEQSKPPQMRMREQRAAANHDRNAKALQAVSEIKV